MNHNSIKKTFSMQDTLKKNCMPKRQHEIEIDCKAISPATWLQLMHGSDKDELMLFSSISSSLSLPLCQVCAVIR
jgi:hypothetical protein